MNSGRTRWNNVTLVHKGGFKALTAVVSVPELAPGERGEVVVQFPPISDLATDIVKSYWQFVYKGHVTFGPQIWLCVRVKKSAPVGPLTHSVTDLGVGPTEPE